METNWSSLSASVHQEDGSSVPQIGLSLELGRGSEMLCDEDHKVVVNNKNRPLFQGFTILQLQELQLQALIFKYIEAALPVPYHLLLPIWQSFSSSLASYPTSIGINPMCLDSRKGIEQEPWRCRRTDGKKWRCSKEALPHQKYCERHIHRGRHRSRKLVDTSQYGPIKTSAFTASNSITSGINNIGDHAIASNNMTNLSISLPVNGNSSSILSSLGN